MKSEPCYQITLSAGFDEAIEIISGALKKEGFGILTRVDVHKTLKEKLDVDFRPYVILGACNPSLAYQALSADPKVGLMMPCNVTVEALEEGAHRHVLPTRPRSPNLLTNRKTRNCRMPQQGVKARC